MHAFGPAPNPAQAWRERKVPPAHLALELSQICLSVSSLVCFHCDNVDSNWNCLNLKTCEDSDEYCVTKYFGGGVGDNHKQSISKGCSPTCPQVGVDLGLMAFSVKCCKTSFCNTSGAVGVKSSFTVLAVGTLASLLYIFGAKL